MGKEAEMIEQQMVSSDWLIVLKTPLTLSLSSPAHWWSPAFSAARSSPGGPGGRRPGLQCSVGRLLQVRQGSDTLNKSSLYILLQIYREGEGGRAD